LGFAPQKTMRVAQALYEGVELKDEAGPVGLITYMRTDSVRVEPEAISGRHGAFIEKAFGADYLPPSPTDVQRPKNRHRMLTPKPSGRPISNMLPTNLKSP